MASQYNRSIHVKLDQYDADVLDVRRELIGGATVAFVVRSALAVMAEVLNQEPGFSAVRPAVVHVVKETTITITSARLRSLNARAEQLGVCRSEVVREAIGVVAYLWRKEAHARACGLAWIEVASRHQKGMRYDMRRKKGEEYEAR